MTRFSETTDGIGKYTIANGETRYRVVIKVAGKATSKGGFTTKGAAREWRNRTRNEADTGSYRDGKKSRTAFGVFAEDWLATVNVRPSTRAVYRHLLDHQLATWTGTPLANITPTAVRQWHAKLRTTPGTKTGRPPSAAYVLKAYGLLKNICNVAVEEGYLRENPCKVKIGKLPTPDLYCPSPAEVKQLANVVPDEWRTLILLAGYGGLRWGECVALQRRHVDLDAGTVKVEQAVVETVDHHVYLQRELKTAAGERTVQAPVVLVAALKHHLTHYTDAEPEALLFNSDGAQPFLRRGNWTSRVLKPALKSTGLPKVRFHDLRHAAATMAAQGGYTTAELMEHIGHNTPRASMHYQHAADQRMKALVSKLDAIIPPDEVASPNNVVPLKRRA